MKTVKPFTYEKAEHLSPELLRAHGIDPATIGLSFMWCDRCGMGRLHVWGECGTCDRKRLTRSPAATERAHKAEDRKAKAAQ
jgi:hypothetical protein